MFGRACALFLTDTAPPSINHKPRSFLFFLFSFSGHDSTVLLVLGATTCLLWMTEHTLSACAWNVLMRPWRTSAPLSLSLCQVVIEPTRALSAINNLYITQQYFLCCSVGCGREPREPSVVVFKKNLKKPQPIMSFFLSLRVSSSIFLPKMQLHLLHVLNEVG